MRPTSLFALVSLSACLSRVETRQTTVVQVAHTPTPLVIASDPASAPTPTVLVPHSVPPLVVAANGAPSVQCPAAARALAGTPVHLRATATGDGLRYRWTVTRSPQARIYRFAERFDVNDSDSIVGMGAEVPFTSVIVGDYTVHLDVRDAEGRTTSCETPVTMSGHGLRVELSWNTSNTDVDLHAVMGRAPHWFTPSDCYYANRRPDTALGDESVQRWLDTDDTDGEGPENIRVDVPSLDSEYRIGVHYYSSHGQSGPTTAIVVIYCGEQRVAHFTRDLTGDRGGNQQNDFWHVANVQFHPDGTCAVRRHDGMSTPAQLTGGQ